MKKTLLVVCNSLNSRTETFILNHLSFVSEHFELSVLVHNPKIEIPSSLKLKEVINVNIPTSFSLRILKVFRLLGEDFFYLIQFLNPFKFEKSALNLSLIFFGNGLKNRTFEICHAHFGNNGLLLAQLKKAGVLSSRVITTFHGLDFTSKKYSKSYYKDLVKFGDKHIVVTEFSKNKLINLGFSEPSLVKIPVGTDISFFCPGSRNEKNEIFKILFVGRLIELKGVLRIPSLVKQLLSNEVKQFQFVVIGDGDLMHELKALSKDLSGYIEFLGFRNKNEIRNIMQQSDLFLYPGIKDSNGREENQCVTIQEASACGLPIIATIVGGVPESVLDGISGYLVSNEEQIVKKIMWFKNNPSSIRKFGDNGRKFIEENFSKEGLNKQLLKLYHSII